MECDKAINAIKNHAVSQKHVFDDDKDDEPDMDCCLRMRALCADEGVESGGVGFFADANEGYTEEFVRGAKHA